LITKESIKQIITLGLTLVLPRMPILLAAYLLSKENYFFFNKYYYTATMLILWSSFGFEFAISYTKTKYSLLTGSILTNVVITSIVLYFVVIEELNLYEFIAIASYSFFVTAANVVNFRILYTGKTFIYLLTNLLNATFLFIAIVLGRMFSENGLIIGLTLGAALYFITVWVFQFRNEREQFDGKNLKDIYSIGFSSFVINSIVPFLLAADKFIVNHNFENITANSYTFAWGLTAPLFYIGNIFEKMIYAERKEVTKKLVLVNGLLNIALISIYAIAVFTTINISDSILPQSVSKEMVRSITLMMLIGYSIYAIVHFPLNGYLFKQKDKSFPKKIAVLYVIAAAVFVILYALIREELYVHYTRLLFYNFSVLAVLLIIKIAVVVRVRGEKSN